MRGAPMSVFGVAYKPGFKPHDDTLRVRTNEAQNKPPGAPSTRARTQQLVAEEVAAQQQPTAEDLAAVEALQDMAAAKTLTEFRSSDEDDEVVEDYGDENVVKPVAREPTKVRTVR